MRIGLFVISERERERERECEWMKYDDDDCVCCEEWREWKKRENEFVSENGNGYGETKSLF